MTEAIEDGADEDEDDDLIADEADSSEDELQKRFDRMTFVVGTKKLEQLPQWVKVADVFKTDSDAAFLKRAGVKGLRTRDTRNTANVSPTARHSQVCLPHGRSGAKALV